MWLIGFGIIFTMQLGLFAKSKKTDGWLAIRRADDAIYAAHVQRSPSARPVVTLAALYPGIAPEPILEKLAKECRADHYACTTLLAPTEYQILSVDAPSVPPEELKTAIRWRLKDMLDFHVDDAMIDVVDIPPNQNAPVRNRAMYAIAARTVSIEQCQTMFRQAKIPLSVIDIPEMAQRNIAALIEPQGRGVAMLSFDAQGGLLTFTASGELYLARRIDVTLEQLMQSDAEQIRACHDRLTLELQRSLDHFDRQYHYVTLAKLVLAPTGIDNAVLRAYLAENLQLPVEILNLESVFDFTHTPKLMQPVEQQRYFLALGAALRHEVKAL